MTFFSDKPAIASVAAGYFHSIVLLQNGKIYAFGYSSCCGVVKQKDTLAPVLVSIPNCTSPITNIVCSSYCTLAQGSDGTWYAFGNSNQLPPAYGKAVTAVPAPINDVFPISSITKEPIRVRKIVATFYCYLAITEENELYIVGCNTNGELGLGNTNNCTEWTKHPSVDSVVDVQTGWYNVFVLQK